MWGEQPRQVSRRGRGRCFGGLTGGEGSRGSFHLPIHSLLHQQTFDTTLSVPQRAQGLACKTSCSMMQGETRRAWEDAHTGVRMGHWEVVVAELKSRD